MYIYRNTSHTSRLTICTSRNTTHKSSPRTADIDAVKMMQHSLLKMCSLKGDKEWNFIIAAAIGSTLLIQTKLVDRQA